MKKAIEKWIKNGGDLAKQLFPYAPVRIDLWDWVDYENAASSKGKLRVYYQQADLLHQCAGFYSLTDLIFSTDFIDKLVAPGHGWCETKTDRDKCSTCRSKYRAVGQDSEKCYQGHPSGDYHREQMANLKDVEKLKEYVRKLV